MCVLARNCHEARCGDRQSRWPGRYLGASQSNLSFLLASGRGLPFLVALYLLIRKVLGKKAENLHDDSGW